MKSTASPGSRVARFVAGLVVSVVFAFPVIVMILGALHPAGQPPQRSIALPPWPPALGNFPASMDLAGLGRGLWNSLLVVAVFVPLSVVVSSMAGFSIIRMEERRRIRWIGISVIAFLVPLTLVMLGRLLVFRTMHITGTLLPLMVPALLGGSPLFVLLYGWAFGRIPSALFDVAEVEGASGFQLWFRVAMPSVWPATIAVAILSFFLSWSDFVAPLLYLADPRTFTLPLSLRILSGVDVSNIPLMLAGAVIATVPVVLALGGFHVILPRLVRGSR